MATPAKTNTPSPAPQNQVAEVKAAPKTFAELIKSDGYKNQIESALPRGLSPMRMVRTVLTAINRTPKLLKCTKESLWQAVLDCSALGLFPDPLGRAYLVPYGDQCQLIVGYKGLIDLAYRSGMVESIQARCVYDGDEFTYRYGLHPDLTHVPCNDPGELRAVYSVIHIKGSSMATFDVMSIHDVEMIRKRSRAGTNGPWVTDFAEMAKKTVLRRHMKMQPMATEEVSNALAHEDGNDDNALGDAASDALNLDRLKDTFGDEKTVEGEVAVDEKLQASITKAQANGVSGDVLLEVLAKNGGGAGTVQERALKIPADKLAVCLSDLENVTRVAAEEGLIMPLIRNLDIDAYHADKAMSNTKCRIFVEEGPQAFFRQIIKRDVPSEDTDALKLGRVFDMLTFDPPGTFEARCVVKPEGMSFATTIGKAWREEHKHLEIVTVDDVRMFQEMAKSIHANPIAHELLGEGEAQVSIRRPLPALGLEVQSRPDWLNLLPTATGLTSKVARNGGKPYLLDLKTTIDMDLFGKKALEFGYHRQIALGQWLLAREGIQADAYLIAVEKKLGGRTRVKRIPDQFLEAGWNDIKAILEKISARMKSGDWNELQTEIEDLAAPVWTEREALAGVGI